MLEAANFNPYLGELVYQDQEWTVVIRVGFFGRTYGTVRRGYDKIKKTPPRWTIQPVIDDINELISKY